MYLVGLTGGVAAGKSAVADGLAGHGMPVIDVDRLARDVVTPGSPALDEIRARFGPQLIDEDGCLRRRRLGTIVFADDDARRDLERITHPRILGAMERAVADLEAHHGPVVVDIALLVELDLAERFDAVVVVIASPERRRERLTRERGVAPETADGMIRAQATDEERLAVADHVLRNDGTFEELAAQVDTLADALLREASDR